MSSSEPPGNARFAATAGVATKVRMVASDIAMGVEKFLAYIPITGGFDFLLLLILSFAGRSFAFDFLLAIVSRYPYWLRVQALSQIFTLDDRLFYKGSFSCAMCGIAYYRRELGLNSKFVQIESNYANAA
jgi:hypothetical protein